MNQPSPRSGEQLARDAAALFGARVLTVLTTGLLQVALVRLLGSVAWNSTARFLHLATAVSSMAQLGFPESVLYFGTRAANYAQARRLATRTAAVLTGIGGLIGGLLSALPSVGQDWLGLDGPVPWSFGVYLAAELGFAALPSLLVSQRQPRLAGALSFASRLPVAAGALLPAALGAEPEAVLLGLALGSALATAAGWGVALMRLHPRGEPAAEGGATIRSHEPFGWTTQLAFSLPVGSTRVLNTWNGYVDKLLLMPVLGVGYGSYALGAGQIPLVMALSAVSTSAIAPELTRAREHGELERFVALWTAQMSKLALIITPLWLWSSFCAEPLFAVLYPSQDVVLIAQTFVISQLVMPTRFTNYGLVCQSLGRPRLALFAAGASALLNAGGSLGLLHLVGILGPVIATVVAGYAGLVVTLLQLRKELQTSAWALLPPGLVRTLLAAAAPLLALVPLHVLSATSPVLYLTVSLAVYLPLYWIAASALGVLRAPDRAFALALLRSALVLSRAR